MTSDKHYKVWIRDGNPGTGWVELDRFTGLEFEESLGLVPQMNGTFYVTTSSTQDLMTANRIFRITTTESTDGTVETLSDGTASGEVGAASGSWEVMTGVFTQVDADQKTAFRNSKPVIFDVRGAGYLERVGKFVYDDDQTLTGTAAQIIDSGANSILTTIGSGNVAAGTIDTGPSGLSVFIRKDDALSALTDIANLGDGTDLFTYYITSRPNDPNTNDFKPAVNYLSPTNAIFETTDPNGGVDNGRVIDMETEARSFRKIPEKDRVKNAVKVRYQGVGSGTGMSETAFATDATSITNYGRREAIVYAPWIQNSATATFYRDTILDMFKGSGEDGILRGEATLKTGQLFTGSFDAILGDTIAVRRDSSDTTGILTGKFLGFSYSQNSQALTVFIGLPRVAFVEDVATTARRVRQAYNSMKLTETALTTETVPVELQSDNELVNNNLTAATFTSLTPGSGASEDFTVTTSLMEDAHIFYVDIELAPTTFQDGPIQVTVSAKGTGTQELVQHVFTAMQPSTTHSVSGLCYPFAVDDAISPTDIRITITNNTPAGGPSFTLSSGKLEVYAAPQHTVDLSHTHNF